MLEMSINYLKPNVCEIQEDLGASRTHSAEIGTKQLHSIVRARKHAAFPLFARKINYVSSFCEKKQLHFLEFREKTTREEAKAEKSIVFSGFGKTLKPHGLSTMDGTLAP